MGKATRLKPKKLAGKLLKIRKDLGLSQSEMAIRLGYKDATLRNYVSAFEIGTREPPLPILLAYARLARTSTDHLIDDKLKLP